jgi:tetratricopeptide (TPR) repeat protein
VLRKWLHRNWSWAAAAIVLAAVLIGSTLQMRAERDNALRAEQSTRAVKDYIVSVFQAADPEMSGQRDRPVSALLDAGRERLQTTLSDQPRASAELSSILGSVYQSIGKREQALAMFDLAIELARRQAMQQVLAEALHNKAYSLYDMGEFSSALVPAREALALRTRDLPDSVERINSLRLVGSILGYSGDTEEAPQLLNDALQRATDLRGADSVEAASAHLDLARYLGGIGEHPERVLEHAQRAGELFTHHLGDEHFRVSDALEIRTLGMAQSGQAAQAIDLARELVARRTALYGDMSHPRSYALNVLGSLLWRGGRGPEAIGAIEDSLRIHDQLDGPESVASLVPMLTLARVHADVGAHDAALALFERQLRIHAQHQPLTTITPTGLRLHVARNLRALNRLPEARVQLAEVLAALDQETAAAPRDRFDALLEQAALARLQGDLQAAQVTLDAIVVPADDGARAGRLSAERARMALARQQIEQAELLFNEAQAQISAALGEPEPEAWLLRLDLAEWLQQSGAADRARTLAVEIAAQVKLGIDPAGLWAQRLRALGATI